MEKNIGFGNNSEYAFVVVGY